MSPRTLTALARGLFAGALLTLASTALAAPAPDFSLRDINGEQVQLSDHQGKVVLISFWATWCGPCKEEMPHLESLYKAHKDEGFVVLSVSSDDARTASRVKPFIKRSGYTFPVLLDRDSSVIGTYNPNKTLPFTVIVGKDGEIAHVHAGYNPGDEVQLKEHVEELLKAEVPKTETADAAPDKGVK